MDTWAWVSGDGKFFGYTRSLKDAKGHTQRHGGGVISKNADVMMDENNKLWLKLRTSKEKA